MTTFQPAPGDTLDVDVDPAAPMERLRVVAHPAAPWIAHAAEGSEGTVFQVERAATGERFALKVFKPSRQSPALADQCVRLRTFAAIPGLRTCERFCLDPARATQITAAFPALRYAVVMPWIADPPWLDTLATGRAITEAYGLLAAKSLAQTLLAMESFGVSHGDLSGGNVLVHPTTGEVSLVDLEALYAPGFPVPSYTVLGTPGYNLLHSTEGVFSPDADRFAAAVLFAELLTWHEPRVRAAASTRGSYFAPEDIASPTAPRFVLLRDVLAARSARLASLFGNAWCSARRTAAPSARAWVEALDALAPPRMVPNTQELQGPPQVPIDARPMQPTAPLAAPPMPPVCAGTMTLAAPPPVPRLDPSRVFAAPAPVAASPVAFWRALTPRTPSPHEDNPVVGWSTGGSLAPKRFREP